MLLGADSFFVVALHLPLHFAQDASSWGPKLAALRLAQPLVAYFSKPLHDCMNQLTAAAWQLLLAAQVGGRLGASLQTPLLAGHDAGLRARAHAGSHVQTDSQEQTNQTQLKRFRLMTPASPCPPFLSSCPQSAVMLQPLHQQLLLDGDGGAAAAAAAADAAADGYTGDEEPITLEALLAQVTYFPVLPDLQQQLVLFLLLLLLRLLPVLLLLLCFCSCCMSVCMCCVLHGICRARGHS